MRPSENIPLQQSIMRTLLYFDLFRYPLRPDEIFRFLRTNGIAPPDLVEPLNDLVRRGHAFHHNGFYSARAEADLVTRRNAGNLTAQRMAGLAHRRGKLIGNFPFVRGVLASGSFSKGYMDKDSDLDFFIITTPGRLWVARMLIAIYKRVVFFNSHKYFCCNYFITSDHLEIEEKNLFTATELATLIPLCGASCYERLMHENHWIKEFYPNFQPAPTRRVPEAGRTMLKSVLEWLLSGSLGDKLSHKCRRLTARRWERLYSRQYPAADFSVAFKSSASVSKNHPNHYQRRVLERYEERLREFSKKTFRLVPDTES